MKKILLASAALLSVTSAYAADLPRKSTPVMPVAMPVAPIWQGFYLGVQGGWLQNSTSWNTTGAWGNLAPITDPSAKTNSNGLRIGAFIGYNWQFNNIVAGVEADLGYSLNGKKTSTTIPGYGYFNAAFNSQQDGWSTKPGLDGSLRLRAGYLVTPSVLLYATGGLAMQQNKVEAFCTVPTSNWCVATRSDSENKTRYGYTLGGGVEALLGRNWLARVEYRYSDYGKHNRTIFPGTIDWVSAKVGNKTHQVNLGLGYKF